ncbi:caspase b-like isoform X2 [Macrobrachium rosenbergii]|uniref:caspase b-like isoform X2 n=1 Tax=Macrobrachium rosenbergii TaxID=79674 RepID=UPI0034D3F2AB
MAPRITDSHRAKKLSPRSLSAVPSCRRKLFSVPLSSTTPSRKRREIFLAAERGNLQKIKDLIQYTGPAVRKPHSRFTLLHLAALNNQKEIVEFLLEFISPNVVCAFNKTPAHLASLRGHLEVLSVLLADQETNPDIKDVWDQTYKDLLAPHLFEAILSGNEKQTRDLLALGANPDCHPGNDMEGVLSRELHITTPRQLALSLNQKSTLMLLPTNEEGHPVTKHGQILVSPTMPRIGRDPMLGPLRIKVKPTKQCVTGSDVYTMNPNSRGYVCILSFGSFERRPDLELEASEDDASNLANVFTQMGYSGEVHHSLTSDETKETLTRIRDMEELWDASSATFIISSHGTSNNDAFLASDMQQLSTEWLLGLFSDAECPQLKNKPKVFIFDFCRGYYTDSCASVLNPFRPTRVNEPQRDMVCIYSSSTGFTSYNFSKDGSSFPTALCRTMAKHAHDMELNDLCRELVAECGKATNLVPSIRNIGFTKRFFFNPGVSASLVQNH